MPHLPWHSIPSRRPCGSYPRILFLPSPFLSLSSSLSLLSTLFSRSTILSRIYCLPSPPFLVLPSRIPCESSLSPSRSIPRLLPFPSCGRVAIPNLPILIYTYTRAGTMYAGYDPTSPLDESRFFRALRASIFPNTSPFSRVSSERLRYYFVLDGARRRALHLRAP